ncbi:MAG: phospho-sugar mutase [Eubacteriales bacterium]|nr:phospho-sugar mutase [Eubacteriales bacterium]
MNTDIKRAYDLWCEKAEDSSIREALAAMSEDEISEAFRADLTFGTAGLRGVMEPGTDRMNIYTVGRASQGMADYINSSFAEEKRSVAISRDSRNNSELFSRTAASVFAANGIKVHIYREIMPTPCLSFAVRALGCAAGVMITASHNPAAYNGYKAYGSDGCQITSETADAIQSAIENTDVFEDVKKIDFDEGVSSGLISVIPDDVYTDFTEEVKNQSLIDESIPHDCAIVYSPLHGTGLKPVLRALTESGYTNITVVEEQKEPDGDFPTCAKPNPESREAMQPGLDCAEKTGADLVMATDPDADRIGIAVRDGSGKLVLLTGNETGVLLIDYICMRRKETGRMPADPVMVKTIVTTDIAEKVAAGYGVRTVNVLTGFKYIGDTIAKLEAEGRADSYILGFEESCGYLTGTYVRDKDAVDAALMICDMFAYHRSRGVSLPDRLQQIYEKYGFCLDRVHSFEFDGAKGEVSMQRIMNVLRGDVRRIGGFRVLDMTDYRDGADGLPPADVLKFRMEQDVTLIARPSGTEPKLKFYISIYAATREKAEIKERQLMTDIEALADKVR